MNCFPKTFSNPFFLFLIILLFLSNLLVWGAGTHIPMYTLYSSGTVFSNDGKAIGFSERTMLNLARLSHSIRLNWDGKSTTAQFTGDASHGWLGEIDISIQDSSTFGTSLVDGVQLDEDVLFNLSYLQSGHASLKLLPLPVDLNGQCFYLIYLQKVQCGSSTLRGTQK